MLNYIYMLYFHQMEIFPWKCSLKFLMITVKIKELKIKEKARGNAKISLREPNL